MAHLQRPSVSAALFAILASYLFVSPPFTMLHRFTIGYTTQCFQMFDLFVVRERDSHGEASFRGIDQNVDSADELTKLWRDRPEDVMEFTTFSGSRASGLLAVTHRELGYLENPLWSNYSDVERASARRFFADWVAAQGYPAVASRVVSGRLVEIQWTGVALTAAIATLSLAFLCSLGWMFTGSAYRVARRLKADECPRCRYDLSGCVPTPEDARTCPECGSTWPAT